MPSSARFTPFARIQVRPVLALLVPAAAALTLVLAAEPAPAEASSATAAGVQTVAAAQTNEGDNGFSWG
ncbi:hypothetical protein [Streptomyces sp. NPDC039028]|uniref:hypothetical protein n=1 Tax=unclassified Streptomyces TaxID=2593676 RepID=UPI0033DCC8DA